MSQISDTRMPAPPLRFSGLTKHYSGKLIFSERSGAVAPGACVALISHNGSGKSTLLGCLTGHVAADGGHIEIDGHDLESAAVAARSQLRYLPQETPAPKHVSGREFIDFHARVFGVLDQCDAALERSGIEVELYDRPMASYSVGMRRRIHFAAITLGEARLYVLDEPFAGLDGQGRERVIEWLRARTSTGAGVLIAAHSHESRELEQLGAAQCDWLG